MSGKCHVVVIDMSVYMSIADRNMCIFFLLLLLRGAILCLCSLKMSGKVGEKSGNLIMTGSLGWKAELTLVLVVYQDSFPCPLIVTHLSSNHLTATRTGIKPMTSLL